MVERVSDGDNEPEWPERQAARSEVKHPEPLLCSPIKVNLRRLKSLRRSFRYMEFALILRLTSRKRVQMTKKVDS